MTSTMYSVLLFSLAWNAEGSIWGFCASQGNYLKLIGGFTSADFRIGELVAADYAGSCHTGMFAASAQNMSSTGAFYRRTGALFATETYCDASASTSCQCVGAPRCLAQKRCPYDCGCSLSEAGAVGVNSYFSGRTALEFTGASRERCSIALRCSARPHTTHHPLSPPPLRAPLALPPHTHRRLSSQRRVVDEQLYMPCNVDLVRVYQGVLADGDPSGRGEQDLPHGQEARGAQPVHLRALAN
jgi:hypothetical protein